MSSTALQLNSVRLRARTRLVATGNHYVFDIAAGLGAAVAGYLVGRAIQRARG